MTIEQHPMTLEDFWSLKTVSDVRLSPDGATVAYVVGTYDESDDTTHSAIWLANVAGGEARQFTSGDTVDSQPRWSPTGTRLAFVSTRHEGKPQLFVIPRDGGEPRRLTSHEDGASSPVWSPDGARLCYSVAIETDRQKVVRETSWIEAHEGVDKKGPRLRRQASLASRFDGRGYIDRRVHLFVVAVDEAGNADDGPAEPRQLTDGDWDDLDAAWSPDGGVILFVSNRTETAEHNLAADLWTVSPEGGEAARLTNGGLSALGTNCAWSPDGATVAFYAQPEWAANGARDTHVWTVSRHGGDQRDLSAALDQQCGGGVQPDYMSPASSSLAWAPDGRTVYALAMDDGDCAVYAFDATTGAPRRLSPPGATVAGLQPTADGRTLIVLSSTPTRPYDLFTLPTAGGDLAPLTTTNRGLLERIDVVAPEHIRFDAPDGQAIEGWLYTPRDTPATRSARPYPLILNVHGGPFGAWGSCFYIQAQALAGAGYASLYLNPRGSLGHGSAFTRAADWGQKDFEDLMAGVDAVLARGEADPDRLGVTGISYGGFMTNWAVGHTDRFAGAVAVNGVSNFVSMYGVSDITPLWFETEFGGPYWTSDAQWERYRRHSPITYVDRIETPLLLLQSENDYRCPIDQGEQMLTALRIRRRVVELIRFPGASHFIATTALPRHRFLQWRLALDWFDTYVKAAGQAPAVEEEAEEGGVTVAAALTLA